MTPASMNTASVSSSNTRLSLLGLPAELLDLILEEALLSSSPIEFAPFQDEATIGPNLENLSALQYQHAILFQQKVRPYLGLLAVNKHLHAEASKLYYGKNTFSFSGYHGLLILARFFDLIGAKNIQLLRRLIIVHPAHKSEFTLSIEGLLLRQLSPFGMADLSDYPCTYLVSKYYYSNTVPARDPLVTLRGIQGLEKLDLLVYSKERFAVSPASGLSDLDSFESPLTTESFDKDLTWTSQPKLRISLVNLRPVCQCSSASAYLKLSDVESITADPLRHSHNDLRVLEAAKSITAHTRAKGWDIVDHDWCSYTGLWPLSHGSPCPGTELDKYVADYDGWENREELELELAQFRQSVGDAWGECECRAHLAHTLKDCVKCWQRGGFGACICDDRPTFLQDHTLVGPLDFIGNPGQDLHLGSEGRTLIWVRSWAARDAFNAMNSWTWLYSSFELWIPELKRRMTEEDANCKSKRLLDSANRLGEQAGGCERICLVRDGQKIDVITGTELEYGLMPIWGLPAPASNW